ncbi:hypothetical protein K9M47_01105 [Candidatus Gracilibacteria bacterium]|nr:hypothetical protein [Candidatus Gracilibacteria bacterium]MCF7898994.1 hypothetical protein [Candidatus Paceibacterota bacterium]
MIKKIFPNELDLFNMSLKRTVARVQKDKVDYKGLVVDKPWGYEYLMFENNFVAVWILFLKNDAKTSIHCHPKKKTSLLVLDGKVKTSSLDSSFEFHSMEGVIIDRGVFHSTHSLADKGSFVMEIETPVDKGDLVRLKDEYGRENKGYESGEAISYDLDKYDYLHFHDEIKENEEVKKIINNKTIKVIRSSDLVNFYKTINKEHKKIICPLNYKFINKEGKVIFDVGDIIDTQELFSVEDLVSVPGHDLVNLIIG